MPGFTKLLTIAGLMLAVGPAPAAAQFAATEVSGPGAPPFLMTKSNGSVFESIAGITYNIYKRLPNDDFRCLAPDLVTNAWAVEAPNPSGGVWWYSVNGWDTFEENRHGNGIPIIQPCKTPAPIVARKSVAPGTVSTGAQSQFTLEIDNSAGTSALQSCTLSDSVAASGCMTLTSCDSSTPPLGAALSCDLASSTITAAGFDVPAGASQTLTFTVTAGASPGVCDNAFTVSCGTRSGGAGAALTIQAGMADIVVRKTPRSTSAAPGADVIFDIEIENLGGGTARNVRFSDVVDATCCMTLRSCDASSPPLGPALTCSPPSLVSAAGFDIPGGATQTITITATAGERAGSCINRVQVDGDNFASAEASGAFNLRRPCAPATGRPPLRLQQVVNGLGSPVHLTAAPGDPTRLFVVQQGGRIRIVRGGAIVAPDFLNITPSVLSGGEQGLLSMAFHPCYASNGLFYVYYTAPRPGGAQGNIITVAEYQVSANPDVATPASARIIYTCLHPNRTNHNGGQIAFSPKDGYLYIGTGDGGGGGDPDENAENLQSCLGKLLRIDVNGTAPPLQYRIPASNPFVSTPNALPEIWAYGLRNPWRFGFDRETHDLFIGDVGQNQIEEVDVQPGTSLGGEHYGWDTMEGSQCFEPPAGCNRAGKVLPVAEYTHASGCSITGGEVYRGCRLPGYAGTYFYSDYCSNRTWSFEYTGGAAANPLEWTSSFGGVANISSYGVDANGELYVVSQGGAIFRITD